MPILSESGVVTQGVTLGGSSSQYAIVDVSIPSGNTARASVTMPEQDLQVWLTYVSTV
jgi:hypothetical protein